MLETVCRLKHVGLRLAGASLLEQAVEDVKLAYYRLGRGSRPVLMIHGMGDRSVHWHDMAHALRHDAELLIPDLPGSGASNLPAGQPFMSPHATRRVLHRFAAPYRPRRPLLIGHSLGGLYAAQMLLEEPQAYAGAVIINPGGFLMPDSAAKNVAFRDRLAHGHPSALFDRIFHRPAPHWRLLAPSLKRTLGRPSVLAFLDAFPAEDMITAEQIERLPEQTLLYAAKEDTFLPSGTLEGWGRHFPGQVHWLSGAAHAAQVERAGEIAAGVRRLLKTLDDQDAVPGAQ